MNSRQLEARRWLAGLKPSLGRDPFDAVHDAALDLAHEYTAQWDAHPDSNGPQGLARYTVRIARALEYHWWRYSQKHYRPLEIVLDRVRAGNLAFGRFATDVLREVTLAEGVCQHDARATERFLSEFSRVISNAAVRAGGMRAKQELEGFEAELMIPRDKRPPRLSQYAGHTPLKYWLDRVVWNQWRCRLRAHREHALTRDGEARDHEPAPAVPLEEYECLSVLQPVFEDSTRILSAEEALLLKMVLLDGVPQQHLAQLWGVHKSTITRTRRRACQKLNDEFWARARRLGQQTDYEECVQWISEASQQMWLTLANSLAERIRSRGTDTLGHN